MRQSEAAAVSRAALQQWRDRAGANPFERDAWLQRLLQRHLSGSWNEVEARLRTVGERLGPDLDERVAECHRDANLPRLRERDGFGRPVQEIVFHPAYHEVGAVFWSTGVLELLQRPGNEVLAGAIAYLLDQQGEAGHACPIACTAGAIKVLQRLGTADQCRRYLRPMLTSDYQRRLHAAQFVTEVQGGSDVGLNSCRALPDGERPDRFRLHGEKWFCSVADAGVFVVSARIEDGSTGTGGLGLFLVPRLLANEPNGFRIRRLKDKLGTRGMATAEIEFDGAVAEAIGPLDQGFKNLVAIVLDASRVHNALAACGLMRRAFTEAQEFARRREAFGQRIEGFPAVQELLARMNLRCAAGLATTFRILGWTDRLDTGLDDQTLEAARRIAVMINKYWTSTGATRTCRDGIEVLGGNGTVEDFSPLPRLYRDAIVIESWEGTHNTLCAQVWRDFAVRRLHDAWLERLQGDIEALDHPHLEPAVAQARSLLSDVVVRIDGLLAGAPANAAAGLRALVDRMCRLTDWTALAGQLNWELQEGMETDTHLLLELYRLQELEAPDPQGQPRLTDLWQAVSGAVRSG